MKITDYWDSSIAEESKIRAVQVLSHFFAKLLNCLAGNDALKWSHSEQLKQLMT